MRIFAIILAIATVLAPAAYGDVHLKGNLVIQDTDLGTRYLGEVINDTDEAITYVKVTVTATTVSGGRGAEIPNSGFIDGYRDPNTDLNTFLPPGYYAPFMFYGSVDAADIDSYDVSIEYQPTNQAYPDTSDVTLVSGTNVVGDIVGTTFTGEISNNTSAYIYFVEVVIVAKDADGNVLELNAVGVNGDDYQESGSVYTDSLIQPGETAPFKLLTLLYEGDIVSYYAVITYRPGVEGRYHYFGDDDVAVVDEVSLSNRFGFADYQGEIANNTDRDLYFVKVTITSRDAMGTILDVDYTYVMGTDYNISDRVMTPTHIAPGETAPFEAVSLTQFADVATFEYLVTYLYAGEPIFVEEQAPAAFVLDQNYPNPFNPVTTISFTLPEASPVRLNVYNIGGQLVEELVNAPLAAGHHEVAWDASRYSSGIYLYVLSTGENRMQRTMTLVK